jgi:hypothetical protein
MCFLFARKFSPSTLEPLLELAPTVLGFGWWLMYAWRGVACNFEIRSV